VADDTLALQCAINRTYAAPGAPSCESPGAHTVALEGNGRTYRVTAPVRLWIWVRLLGWGATRPALLLPPATPGFGDSRAPAPLLLVVNYGGGAPGCAISPRAGGNTAFGVGVLNVDVAVAPGNPGAVGVSNGAAQGGLLRAMRFDLAADALAGVFSPGWAQQDLTVVGGGFAVLLNHTGAWPSIFRDCVFHGQRLASVGVAPGCRSEWEGFTAVRSVFSSAPAGVDLGALAAGGASARVTLLNCSLLNLTAGAVLPPPGLANGTSSVLLRGCGGGGGTAILLGASDAGGALRAPAGAPFFWVEQLAAGRVAEDARAPGGGRPAVRLLLAAEPRPALPPRPPPDTPPFRPVAQWVVATAHGVAAGGGDAAPALRALLSGAPAGAAIFFPSGVYVLNSTVEVPPAKGLALFGLHVWDTVLSLGDGAPGFQDPAAPSPLLRVPGGGGGGAGAAPHLSGLNLRSGQTWGAPQPPPVPAGWANPNPGAIALLWEADAAGGGGQDLFFHPNTFPDNKRDTRGPNTELSLVVRGAGGAVFADVWSANAYSAGGALVNGTRGVTFYQLSSEHHAGAELRVAGGADVAVHAMQTEDRSPDAAPTASITVEGGSRVVVTGLFSYYAANVTSEAAVAVDGGSAASVAVFRQWHSYHPFFYNCSLWGPGGLCVNATDFALVNVGPKMEGG